MRSLCARLTNVTTSRSNISKSYKPQTEWMELLERCGVKIYRWRDCLNYDTTIDRPSDFCLIIAQLISTCWSAINSIASFSRSWFVKHLIMLNTIISTRGEMQICQTPQGTISLVIMNLWRNATKSTVSQSIGYDKKSHQRRCTFVSASAIVVKLTRRYNDKALGHPSCPLTSLILDIRE